MRREEKKQTRVRDDEVKADGRRGGLCASSNGRKGRTNFKAMVFASQKGSSALADRLSCWTKKEGVSQRVRDEKAKYETRGGKEGELELNSSFSTESLRTKLAWRRGQRGDHK